MSNLPSPDDLDTLFQGLKSIVAHPEMQTISEEILNLPPDQRPRAIAAQFTSEALAARGIPIPDGMIISGHSIDNPDDPVASTARATLIQPEVSASSAPPPVATCIYIWGVAVLCGHTGGPSKRHPAPGDN